MPAKELLLIHQTSGTCFQLVESPIWLDFLGVSSALETTNSTFLKFQPPRQRRSRKYKLEVRKLSGSGLRSLSRPVLGIATDTEVQAGLGKNMIFYARTFCISGSVDSLRHVSEISFF